MRTLPEVLAEARATDWALWDVRPADRLWDYRPESVPAAFDAIAAVVDEPGSQAAYHRLMDALGHDHSGTPNPAMVPGVRLLAELVPLLHGWQLAAVIDVLTDCLAWTRGDGEFVAHDGRTYNLSDDTAQAVQLVRPTLEQLVRRNDDQPARPALSELLDLLNQTAN